MEQCVDRHIGSISARDSEDGDYLGDRCIQINTHAVTTAQSGRSEACRQAIHVVCDVAVAEAFVTMNQRFLIRCPARALAQKMPNQKVHSVCWIPPRFL